MVRISISVLLSVAATVTLFILLGIYGALFPNTGPIVFLAGEVFWIVGMLVVLVRGFLRLRTNRKKAATQVAFSAASLIFIGFDYAWVLLRHAPK